MKKVHFRDNSISFPSNIENIQNGRCLTTDYLTNVTLYPCSNKDQTISLYDDNKFNIGKSDQKSDIFDILLFAKKLKFYRSSKLSDLLHLNEQKFTKLSFHIM